MRYIKIILFIAVVTITACAKDKEAEHVDNQEKTINTYWATKEVDSTTVFEKTIVDDIYRIVLVPGERQAIAAGDIVSFYYTGAVLTSSGLTTANIFDTNIAEVAKTLGLSTEAELTICEDVAGQGRFISGLDKGLLQMHKGEKAQIIFTSKHGYGNKVMSSIPAYSPIIFEISIEDVKKQQP